MSYIKDAYGYMFTSESGVEVWAEQSKLQPVSVWNDQVKHTLKKPSGVVLPEVLFDLAVKDYVYKKYSIDLDDYELVIETEGK